MSGFVFMRATSLFIRPTLACISEKISASESSSPTLPSNFSSFVIASTEITAGGSVEGEGARSGRRRERALGVDGAGDGAVGIAASDGAVSSPTASSMSSSRFPAPKLSSSTATTTLSSTTFIKSRKE